jgi:hypothetical protein
VEFGSEAEASGVVDNINFNLADRRRATSADI